MIRLVLVAVLFVWTPAFAAPSLAIGSIENHTGDPTLDGAGRGVAAILTSKFTRVDAIKVVEREQLDALLAEIELGQSGLVDPATAVETGRLINADFMVFGSVASAKLPAISITIWVVDVESAQVIASHEVRGEIGERGEEFFVIIDDVAFAILDALEVRLAARDRIAFGEVDVRQLSTVDVYGRALDAIAAGDSGSAKQLLSRAVTLEPEFTLAEEALIRLASEVSSRKSAWAHEAIEASHAAWKDLDALVQPAAAVQDPGPEDFAKLALLARLAQIHGEFDTYFELEERRIDQTTAWVLANQSERERPGESARDFRPKNTFDDAVRDALRQTETYGQRDRIFRETYFWPWQIKHQLAETLFLLGQREQAMALVIENYQTPGPTRSWSEGPGHPFDVTERWDQWQTHVAFAQQRVRQAELGGDKDELIRANKDLGDALSQAESQKKKKKAYEDVMRRLTSKPSTVEELARLMDAEDRVVHSDLIDVGHAVKGYTAFIARVESGFYDAAREHDRYADDFEDLADGWRDVANSTFRDYWYADIKLQHQLTYQEQVPPANDEEAARYKTDLEDDITSWYRK